MREGTGGRKEKEGRSEPSDNDNCCPVSTDVALNSQSFPVSGKQSGCEEGGVIVVERVWERGWRR